MDDIKREQNNANLRGGSMEASASIFPKFELNSSTSSVIVARACIQDVPTRLQELDVISSVKVIN